MILLSLVLVLLSLGLLIGGLAGATSVLVWASIVASLAAGGCLALAVLRRPRVAAESAVEVVAAVSGSTGSSAPAKTAEVTASEARSSEVRSSEVRSSEVTAATRAEGVASDPVDAAGSESYPDPPDEPAEEDVSAPTVLRVVDLDAEVIVVDGRPRYHLSDCPHLAGKEAVPLPVSEARESGFTPCSLCKPDATLTAAAQQPAAQQPADHNAGDSGAGDSAAGDSGAGDSAAGDPASGGSAASAGGAGSTGATH